MVEMVVVMGFLVMRSDCIFTRDTAFTTFTVHIPECVWMAIGFLGSLIVKGWKMEGRGGRVAEYVG
jgi:hypothetical protein